MDQGPTTPLMRQYAAAKQQVPGALLMFRLGDFYELFYEDAVVAARELEITLTARTKDRGEPVPMCGVPYHAAEGYIARLLQKGYRVAICEQMEQPGPGKKLVRREVTRILTPGTATDHNFLRSHENNYLAAAYSKGGQTGLAYADLSTGEFRVTTVPDGELVPALEVLSVRELLVAENTSFRAPCLETPLAAWTFSAEQGDRLLREHFRLHSLDGLGLAGRLVETGAAAALLSYLQETQRSALDHLNAPAYYARQDQLVLDAATVRNLELVSPLFAGERKDATLLAVLDQTVTGMGGRLLRQRLLAPWTTLAEVEPRLTAVTELAGDVKLRTGLRTALAAVLDVERLLAKVTLSTAGPRDLGALSRSFAALPQLAHVMHAARAELLRQPIDPLADLCGLLGRALAESLPQALTDGGVVRDGFHPELDELRDLARNSRQYLAAIESRERTATGIASLKVRFNNVFGYYLEISRANLHLVPSHYERRQTLANAERFTTAELKELEAKILEADDRALAIERTIFEQLRSEVAGQGSRIKQTGSLIAEWDYLAALAQVAVDNRYVRPQFSDSGEMRIEAGRHPVVEKLAEQEATRFIPNDLHLDSGRRFVALLTGPNMGGKSTYLRQAALILVMAHMGSFVPAGAAILPLVDRIFTRVGAADNLAQGRSTFMVEMTETAAILNTATDRSFVVLDEIGRGTSTFDGLALAWAVIEYVEQQVRAKTLFATHYHELTELAEQLPGVRNLRVAVKEAGDQILFIRKVEPGAADRSYGIEVARLAGLPPQVIERARSVLLHHEKRERTVSSELNPGGREAPLQIKLFEPVNQGLADRVRALDINELRPVEALQILQELQLELTQR